MVIVIEFLGMPRAGKSSVIAKLAQELGSRNLRVSVIADRSIETKISVGVEWGFAYNLLFFNKVLEEYFTAKLSGNYDVIILDRGFFDSIAWFNTELATRAITSEECYFAQAYFSQFRKEVTYPFLFLTEPSLTYTRHAQSDEWSQTQEYVFSKNYLQKLYCEYISMSLLYNPYLTVIDGRKSIAQIYDVVCRQLDDCKESVFGMGRVPH